MNPYETPIIDSAYVVMPFEDRKNDEEDEEKDKDHHAIMGCLELCMYAEGSRHQEEIIVTGTKVSIRVCGLFVSYIIHLHRIASLFTGSP